jgi:hypothetical protein
MSQVDDIRVRASEEELSTTSPDLLGSLKEIDERTMGANVWTTIIFDVDDLISEIQYFSDAAKTQMTMKRVFSRTQGADAIDYITGMVTTVYNDNASVDSVITTTLSRTDDIIDSCSSSFSTTESIC